MTVLFCQSDRTLYSRLCRAVLADAASSRRPSPIQFSTNITLFVDTLHSDKHKEKDDSWPCFPNTRRQILKTILEHRVQNVIFLSGDIHCSCVAKLEFESPYEDLVAFSIVSSAFYWPFSFADGDPAGYVHDSRDQRTKDGFDIGNGLGTLHYKAWGFTQDDNFCRIDVDPTAEALSLQTFDWDGSPIKRSQQDGSRSNQAEQLKLAPWK